MRLYHLQIKYNFAVQFRTDAYMGRALIYYLRVSTATRPAKQTQISHSFLSAVCFIFIYFFALIEYDE